MRIKTGFAKREIAGAIIVVPVGKTTESFNGMITLNESGSFFWDCLKKDTTPEKIVERVMEEYEADKDIVKRDVDNFIDMLRKNNLLDE